jgi:hypothetical protein
VAHIYHPSYMGGISRRRAVPDQPRQKTWDATKNKSEKGWRHGWSGRAIPVYHAQYTLPKSLKLTTTIFTVSQKNMDPPILFLVSIMQQNEGNPKVARKINPQTLAWRYVGLYPWELQRNCVPSLSPIHSHLYFTEKKSALIIN